MSHNVLVGSERQALPGAHVLGPANPAERFEITLILRRKAKDEFKRRVAAAIAGNRSLRVKHEDFGEQFGAEHADIAAVRSFAERYGLKVANEAQARRSVTLSGTVAQYTKAFSVELSVFEHPGGTYRGRVGSIHLPDELQGIVEAVLGLDNRPQAKAHFRVGRPLHSLKKHRKTDADTSYTPLDVAQLYGFPPGTGNGQSIGIIELGGGYRPADLTTYFSALGVPAPTVTAVSVDQATNSPTGDPNSADGEVFLDIEVAGAIAPGASIAVYFAPNTDQGFLDAVTTAIHDTVNKPTVISISWGGPESTWTQQALTAFDEALQAAATLGITVTVAVGDNGSSDGVTDGQDHVDFPASSPYALACGGTSVQSAAGRITSEVVWDDAPSGGATGGGQSGFFALPAWQAGLQITTSAGGTTLTNRGVPDVSGDADPQTGYQVLVDGSNLVFGGTSAVAPLWAAIIARINGQIAQPVGYINAQLYRAPTALNDITQGNNGDFFASAGWDACTGLGSPNGAAIARLFENPSAANVVQTEKGETHPRHAREHAKTS